MKTKIISMVAVVMIVVAFGYFTNVFDNLLNPKTDAEKQFKERQQWYKQEEAAGAKMQKDALALLAADTYGGATPEETLEMYIDALRAGDAGLASKYYFPWEQEEALEYIKDWMADYPNGLQEYLDAYDVGIFEEEERTIGYYMVMYKERGDEHGYGVNMQLNKVNNLWKITDKLK